MYDTMMRTMFYKGCDIRDGEQMYRLYGQCRKKSKTRIKRLEKAAVECDKMFSIDKKQIMFIKRK